jgi:hypothetical protein
VVLGDQLFGVYATLADLPRRGINVVARLGNSGSRVEQA